MIIKITPLLLYGAYKKFVRHLHFLLGKENKGNQQIESLNTKDQIGVTTTWVVNKAVFGSKDCFDFFFAKSLSWLILWGKKTSVGQRG